MTKNKHTNRVIYTCITGNYDNLLDHSYIDPSWDYICFVDKKTANNIKSKKWLIRPIEFNKLDDVRNQRWHKIHPHLLFPDYEESLWIDANINILNSSIFKHVENLSKKPSDISIPPHFARNCLYDELWACIDAGKDDELIMNKQISLIKKAGFPKNFGLFETNLIYRKHNQKNVIKLMQDWWWWVENYSRRDQLSLTYVLWKNKQKVENFINIRNSSNAELIYTENHITKEELQDRNKKLSNKVSELEKDVLEKNSQINQTNLKIDNLLEKERREREKIEEYKNRISNKKEKIEHLEKKYSKVAEERDRLKDLVQMVNEKNEKLETQVKRIADLESAISQKDNELNLIKSSKFWKLRNRYIKIKDFDKEEAKFIAKESKRVIKEKGVKRFLWCIPRYIAYGKEYFVKKKKPSTDYDLWIKNNEKWNKEKIREKIKKFKYKPKVSIITPVYNVDPVWLDKCIESVRNQFYTNWELCLWDDASTKKETIACLKKWKKMGDKRIKIGFGKKNEHICGASNNAIGMATGEFIALLDNDDELSPDALYENIKALNKHRDLKFIYSDEDKLELAGNRVEPFFKPDWSPDLLYSNNYICHLTFFKKSLGDQIDWFREGYEGAQDYDLILRLTEQLKNNEIAHIPKILYHWRKIPGSTAERFGFKNYANLAGKKALKDFMKRNDVKGKVECGKFSGSYRIKRKIIDEKKVAIIIPFRDQAKILKKCVNSILEKTVHYDYEIMLVNNQSREEPTLKYLAKISKNSLIRILKYDKPFNFSAINNYAVSQTDAPYILFLNNDTSVISYGWLSAMVEHIQREEVGAVGAKLLYPNNTIQHAGVVMGLGIASHPFLGFPKRDNGYFGFLNVTKNYSAITAACLLTKRQLFNELGGFDEKNLGVAYNDVDYCLRLIERGFLITYTPYAKLYHYESLSRGLDNEDNIKKNDPKKYQRIVSERKYMLEKWKKVIKNDPYYNPNLTRLQNNFGIKIGPEDVRYI